MQWSHVKTFEFIFLIVSWRFLHANTCKEEFDWEKTSTLKIEDRRFDRKVREALEIRFRETSPRNKHGLNQDDGQYVATAFWKPMLSYLR